MDFLENLWSCHAKSNTKTNRKRKCKKQEKSSRFERILPWVLPLVSRSVRKRNPQRHLLTLKKTRKPAFEIHSDSMKDLGSHGWTLLSCRAPLVIYLTLLFPTPRFFTHTIPPMFFPLNTAYKKINHSTLFYYEPFSFKNS